MKIAKLVILLVIAALVLGFMKSELRHLMHEGFWPGLTGVLICIGLFVVVMALKSRATANAAAGAIARARMAPRPEVDRLIAKFPGPITLKPSRAKWWIMTVLGTFMTAATFFIGVLAFVGLQAGQKDAGLGLGFSAFGTCFFGLATVIFVAHLFRGALQLDRDGFQVTLLGRRRFLWTEVADFLAYRAGRASGVSFNAVRPRWRYAGEINALFGRGNNSISDTYGLGAEELAQLLEAWQAAALVRSRAADHPRIQAGNQTC